MTTGRNPLADQPVPMFVGEPVQSFSGYEPKKLFQRSADGRFDECSFVEGFESRLDGRSLVAADLDGDGDLDLLMTNRNSPRLQFFENVGAPGRSVELVLEATKGHREADGAQVLVDGLGVFPVVLNRGYSSSVDPAVHVGLGGREAAHVRVKWRSGAVEDFGDVAAGARVALREGTGQVKELRRFAPSRPVSGPKWPTTLDVAPAGAVTVVQLFMESCKPCREEVPALNALAKRGVRVVGLGLHDAEALPRVKAALKIAYDVAPMPEAVAQALESHGSLPLPMLLVYGADGKLLRLIPGAAQLPKVLDELGLAAPRP